jgi:hypothetical protein
MYAIGCGGDPVNAAYRLIFFGCAYLRLLQKGPRLHGQGNPQYLNQSNHVRDLRSQKEAVSGPSHANDEPCPCHASQCRACEQYQHNSSLEALHHYVSGVCDGPLTFVLRHVSCESSALVPSSRCACPVHGELRLSSVQCESWAQHVCLGVFSVPLPYPMTHLSHTHTIFL